jgi:hypothetical protein
MEATNSSKTRREAALLVLVVFLLGLLVGGVGNHLWGERVWGRQQIGPHQGPPSREEIVNRLTVELQLTPDQQKQIGPIIDDTRSQVRALYEPVDAEHDKIRQQGAFEPSSRWNSSPSSINSCSAWTNRKRKKLRTNASR